MKKLKLRGFRLARAFKWIVRQRRRPDCFLSGSRPVPAPTRSFLNPLSKILAVARYLKRRTKALLFENSDPGYILLEKEEKRREVPIPKGHLTVYVEERGGDRRRAMVPVVYVNHPLFGELLKESERVYGYDHPGGITIPCGYSEFEEVKMRIAAWDN